MSSVDPDAGFAALRNADPDVMDRDGLAELIRQLAAHRAWCDSLQVRITRRQRQLALEGRAEAPKDLLSRDGGQSGRDARTADDREKICTTLPSFEDALSAGSVSAGHVDAIATAVRDLDQQTAAEFLANHDSLLAKARGQGVDTFAQTCRELARQVAATHAAGSDVAELERQKAASKIKRWTDRETGMRHTLICLDPVRDRMFWTAVASERARLRHQPAHAKTPWEQLEVEALISACSAGEGGQRVPSMIVLADFDTLRSGLHSNSVCETDDGTPLPVEVMRRLACEAEIIPVVLNGAGQALDAGRAQRLATPAQRAALRAMHRTCVGPTCSVPFEDCEIHHIVPWERGGKTDLANMAPLCSGDHHLVHEGGWGLAITSDRVATWTRPDGAVFHIGSTIDRAPTGLRSDRLPAAHQRRTAA